MKAILTLSLGGTYPAPPNTRRGTIEKPIAAAPVCPMNLRRETKPPGSLRDPSRFFTVPPNRSSQIPHDFACYSHLALVYHTMDLPATSSALSSRPERPAFSAARLPSAGRGVEGPWRTSQPHPSR